MPGAGIRIGDVIFKFDVNRRKYARPPRGSGRVMGDLIYSEHFEPWVVVGQTAQSWKCKQRYSDGSLGMQTATINKKTMLESGRHTNFRYYTDAEKYQNEWLHVNRAEIYRAIQMNNDYTVWLSIAKLLNVKTKEPT